LDVEVKQADNMRMHQGRGGFGLLLKFLAIDINEVQDFDGRLL